MANRTWVGGTVGNTSDWFTLGNWGLGIAIPLAADDIFINGTPNSAPTIGLAGAVAHNITIADSNIIVIYAQVH